MTDTKPTPYAWTVTGTAQMFFGDYAQHDAEQEAKHIGGTARAFPLFLAPQPPAKAHVEQKQSGWINPNNKSQKQFLPHIGEAVLLKHDGRVYTGKHTGGSFKADFPLGKHFDTWDCLWMYPSVLDAQKSQAQAPKPLTDDKVYESIKGIDSLDALAVWRAAESAHGITEKKE